MIVVAATCGDGDEPLSLGDDARTPAPIVVGDTAPTASVPPATPIVSHGGSVNDYVGLVDNLRAVGATVAPAVTVSQPFFAPQGRPITVDGQDVQAFEFASAAEADLPGLGGNGAVDTCDYF